MSEEQERNSGIEVVPPTEDVPPTSNSIPEPSMQQNAKNETTEVVKTKEIVKEDASESGDSEAETLIQSPEKKRTMMEAAPSLQPTNGSTTVHISTAPSRDVQSRKRKRSINESQSGNHSPTPERRSSPLSWPAAHAKSGDSDSDRSSRKRTKNSRRNGGHAQSPESDVSVSAKRKNSDNHDQGHSYRKEKRSIDSGERRETRSATYPRPSDDERSPSPHLAARREHRRGTSTQLTAHELERKKRGRPPLLNTRRHRSADRTGSPESDEDSPAPPRSALHRLTGIDNDTMSPAKTGPRKWRDKNGRTWVARAANNNDLEGVRARLAERPGDLDLADNAGNSPLQIAALEGFISIVEYLLQQGCDVDSRNVDKDTPLIDAVENGHVEVIKLLLSHGANPRIGNAKGDEPYELVPQDDENYTEIRRLLAEAKERNSGSHRAQNQNEPQEREGGSSSRAASAASPRDSPPAGPRSPPATASRRRTGRSESTRNDLLWQANTQENLTKLAGKGDTQGVASILNILQKASTESLIAAAKAGHNDVLQYLLAMGEPEIDPDPLRSYNPGYNTPLLAAIGRGHVDVVKLLVNQPGFNPTRRVMGKTYHDFAEERKGQEWQREYEVLKAAHDRSVAAKVRKQNSPRKTRDLDKARARPTRRSSSPVADKRASTSPTMTHKSLPTKSTDSSPRERRKIQEGAEKAKGLNNRGEVLDSASIAVSSDLDQTINNSKKVPRPRRSQSDLPPPRTLDNEAPYRRRRLVTGKEHRRNKSTAPESGSEDDFADMIEVKKEDRRTPTLKRTRTSLSPESKQIDDAEKAKVAMKKRRMVESSPEEPRSVPVKTMSDQPSLKELNENNEPHSHGKTISHVHDKDNVELPELPHTDTISLANTEPALESIEMPNTDPAVMVAEPFEHAEQVEHLEDQDIASNNGPQPEVSTPSGKNNAMANSNLESSAEGQPPLVLPTTSMRTLGAIDDVRAPELSSGEELNKAAAEAALENELAEQKQRRKQAAELKEAEAIELARQQAQLAALKEAEKSEALARRKEEEEEQMRLQLEIRLRRENEEREQELQRITKLPATLARCAKMIDKNDPLVRSHKWLEQKFALLWVVETRQMAQECSPAEAKQRWIPNFQVMGLFATKDFSLKSYPTLETRLPSAWERSCMWRFSKHYMSYDDPTRNSWKDPRGPMASNEDRKRYEKEQRDKFMQLPVEDFFWVKLSTFLELVPQHSHLSGLELPTLDVSLAAYNDSAASLEQQAAIAAKSSENTTAVPLTNGTHVNGVLNGNTD